VRAVGTSFTVRRLPSSPVVVLVQEGIVEVRDAAAPVVRLTANMRATAATAGAGLVSVTPAQIQRELTWREGRISFEGETLQAACAEFARYSETKIVVDDAELGKEEISGTFRANDPIGFGTAVAEALGVRVEVGEGEVRLLR
jgi:transmembrane sensor